MEIAMNDTLASASHQAAWPETSGGPAEGSRRHYSLSALRDIIATWRERMYVRRELERLLNDNPELIDDVGLTRCQIEAEIAKPFWHHAG
jgi:uncharacterized protein YjiS (DUF1127 family)